VIKLIGSYSNISSTRLKSRRLASSHDVGHISHHGSKRLDTTLSLPHHQHALAHQHHQQSFARHHQLAGSQASSAELPGIINQSFGSMSINRQTAAHPGIIQRKLARRHHQRNFRLAGIIKQKLRSPRHQIQQATGSRHRRRSWLAERRQRSWLT
jgi:G3E family GTPase